ncbi:MAG TPA: hypothetical protein VMB03_14305 [Bryobacteraceae bacterium]|nr:hypothetical protein [Bryobacteraceae bacterium]
MRIFALVLTTAALAVGISTTAPKAAAQVGIEVGVAPDCPYGYYDVPPYACAPAGYYGPEWFSGGVFIGAGPWFHGPEHFHGYVDNHFDRAHYHGSFPHAGDRAEQGKRVDAAHFHGNEMRDGHGHVVKH